MLYETLHEQQIM